MRPEKFRGNDKMENCVAEIQGIYGPVTVPERVLQKIWHTGDFRRGTLKTRSGKTLKIIKPGAWNKLDGPDFKDAELEIDGEKIYGDIEIHFYENDWKNHGHDKNPAYGKTVLHVILFPEFSESRRISENSNGETMETFLLLPCLNRDLEEYAVDEALVEIEARLDENEDAAEWLAAVPADGRFRILKENARERWTQKCRFLKKRMEEDGWTAFCHNAALETLGLKQNRTQMLHLAQRFSPSVMLGMDAETLFKTEEGNWKLFPIRPANHPKRRIEQYLELLEKNPDWRIQLKAAGTRFPKFPIAENAFSKKFRKQNRMSEIHKFFAEEIFAGTIAGTRFETLLIDAFLPAVSVVSQTDLFDFWFHWFPGDMPAAIPKNLRKAGVVSPEQPMSNGLFQGFVFAEYSKQRG